MALLMNSIKLLRNSINPTLSFVKKTSKKRTLSNSFYEAGMPLTAKIKDIT